MAEIPITLMLPSGRLHHAEMRDDVSMGSLLPMVVAALRLPDTNSNGRPMIYRIDSQALGRELENVETLRTAGVPHGDRLLVTADITAGSSVAESPRMRRLRSDHQRMVELDARSDLIDVQAFTATRGMPPERYIVTYHVPSIVGIDKKGNPKIGDKHQVEIYLHSDYPHRWPGLKWLTPIWHPNINHANGSVCIDAAWWGAARALDRLVIMMGEMLQYKNYHDDPTKPPFPWDQEAAAWCRSYRAKNPDVFPLDQQELMRPERVKLAGSGAAKPEEKKSRIKLSSGDKKPNIKLKK